MIACVVEVLLRLNLMDCHRAALSVARRTFTCQRLANMVAFYISLGMIGAIAMGSIALDQWYKRHHGSGAHLPKRQ